MIKDSLVNLYRPQLFSQVYGQKYPCSILTASIKQQRILPGYLIYGSYGTGKTSLARIFAKAILCENSSSGNPCRTCTACKNSDSDITEVDGATYNKLEDMTHILESAHYLPFSAKKKVFIIDEVHMLTMHSFNAFLKTLEEPPATAVFILVTTNPDKVPATIRSRCLVLETKPLTFSSSLEFVTNIAADHKIQADPIGLEMISAAGQGSMRSLLYLLEQLKINPNSPANLGYVSYDCLDDICQGILTGDGGTIFAAWKKIDVDRSPIPFLSQLEAVLESGIVYRETSSITKGNFYPKTTIALGGSALINTIYKNFIKYKPKGQFSASINRTILVLLLRIMAPRRGKLLHPTTDKILGESYLVAPKASSSERRRLAGELQTHGVSIRVLSAAEGETLTKDSSPESKLLLSHGFTKNAL